MKKLIFAIYPLIVLAVPSCSKKSGTTMEPFKQIEQPAKTYGFESTVTWSDEFDANGAPDPAKWTYDVGGSGWGNNELEYYTNTTNNAVIKDGALTITAKKESLNGMNYTSSRMVSKNG